ncbi:MAG: LPS-assembly protein LptD [Gammaproteobacteria bacterium]
MKRIHFNSLCTLICLVASAPAWTQVTGTQGNWPLCPAWLDIPPRPVVDETLQPDDSYITADQANLVEEGVSHLQGNVELTRNAQQARADSVDYDRSRETAELQGDVNYWDNEVYLHSNSAHLDLGDDSGTFHNADYRILSEHARGKADVLFIRTKKLTRGKHIDYSTCDPGGFWDLTNNIWKLSAKELTLNHETNQGSGKNVVLRIKGIPVFYTPYISFPLKKQRKSGFLIPSYGSSVRNGLEFRAPFYWNIAPNMDATVTPRLITDSGVMLMGEYRYLFPWGSGVLTANLLPGDDEFNNQNRSFVSLKHQQTFAQRGRLNLLLQNVSDDRYFEDFGDGLNATSVQFLERRADLSYAGRIKNINWNLFGRVQDFQIVDRGLPVTSRPYKRLPQIRLNASLPRGNDHFNFAVQSEGVYFDRGEDPSLNNVNGFRFDIKPSISYPIRTEAAYLRPKVGLRFTQYRLENNNLFGDSPNRLLPFVSLDSGVFFERDLHLFKQNYLQTLEPRFFYLYIPRDNQSDLPVFDTGIYDFSFQSIFYEDRFSGKDRVGDTNQVSLSLTSRLISSTGTELGRFSIGQAYYLRDQKVVLPGQPVQTDTLSPIIAEVSTTFFDNWTIRGALQQDVDDNVTQKLTVRAQYRPADGKVLNLAYRVRRGKSGLIRRNVVDIEQTDASLRWPLFGNWSVVGRWNYAVPEKKSLDLFAGLEYNSCCWGFRVIGRRFLTNLDSDYQTGAFLEVELKGLAGLGQKTVDFLRENIPGYKSEF